MLAGSDVSPQFRSSNLETISSKPSFTLTFCGMTQFTSLLAWSLKRSKTVHFAGSTVVPEKSSEKIVTGALDGCVKVVEPLRTVASLHPATQTAEAMKNTREIM